MAKNSIELPKWAGRDILDESHLEELDSRASAHEMDSKLPRSQAEEEAYREYTKDHHAKAAAHHLMGMKGAQGAGSMDEARKHGAMYGLHIKALGEDPYGPVPAKVKQHVDSPDRDPVFKFKAHKGDAFLLKDGEKDREPEQNLGKSEDLEKAWGGLKSSSKVGQYETKRCASCKRETLHEHGTCRACKKPSAPEASPAEVSKSEVDFDRLHTLYKAIKLTEAFLAKGDVIQGNFPKHAANPQAQGPAAPVTKLPVTMPEDLAGRLPPMRANGSRPEPQETHVREILNRFLHGLGNSQPFPRELVGKQWLHEIKPGHPGCGHDNAAWSESGDSAVCPDCGGAYSIRPGPV